MKKYMFILISFFFLFACSSYEYDLEKMSDAVKSHFRYKDAENGTITKIEILKPVSYEEMPENERESPDEVYLCKVYVRGIWSYSDSYRVYNIDDTLKSYFNKNKVFLRMDGEKR